MKKKIIAILLLVCFTVLLEGCEGKSTGGAKIIEPEELISKQEAEALLGIKLKDAEKSEQEVIGMKLCMYDSQEESGKGCLQITLSQKSFMPKDNTNTPESIFKSIKEGFNDAVKVEGVGDEAIYAAPGIHILKSGYYITIYIMSSDKKKNDEILANAGKKAVENLEKHLN